jgi:uncharacterized membrane protein
MDVIRHRYGSSVLHLLAVLATMAVAGYAFIAIVARPDAVKVLLWFGGAIVAHDLISFPLYSALALIAGRAAGVRAERLDVRRAAALNHVRVPALLSAFALVAWFPLVLGLSADRYRDDTALSASPYLGRWLLLTAALFAGSGVVYALRLRSDRRS